MPTTKKAKRAPKKRKLAHKKRHKKRKFKTKTKVKRGLKKGARATAAGAVMVGTKAAEGIKMGAPVAAHKLSAGLAGLKQKLAQKPAEQQPIAAQATAEAAQPVTADQPVFCTECGAKNYQMDKFCRKCGEELG
jgi:membrane protease subunit (stomatin/prohibitin family)